jgi:CDGSH-type Zn-finger protein
VDAPNGGRIPTRLADSCLTRDIHAGGDTVAKSPEQELADFLAPLPLWLQKVLWQDFSSMTDLDGFNHYDSTFPFTSDQLEELRATAGLQPERYPQTAEELRPKFEQILQRCGRAEWKKYCDNAKAKRKADADRYVQLPHGKPGRKRNDEMDARIWALRSAGMTTRQIQETLNARGENMSLEAVEAYFKTRRRTQPK